MPQWDWIIAPLRDRFQEDLISIVVFGSFARGEAKEGSDLDILVILRELPQGIDRLRLSAKVSSMLRPPPEFPKTVSPVVMTVREIERHPPILLDMVDDSIILYDRERFFERILRELRERLRELGAVKVKVNGGWYWILKPDAELGEVVEI